MHSLLAPDACCRQSGHKSSMPVLNAAAWKDAVCNEHSLTNEGRMIMNVSLKQSVLNHIIISQRAVCQSPADGLHGHPGPSAARGVLGCHEEVMNNNAGRFRPIGRKDI